MSRFKYFVGAALLATAVKADAQYNPANPAFNPALNPALNPAYDPAVFDIPTDPAVSDPINPAIFDSIDPRVAAALFENTRRKMDEYQREQQLEEDRMYREEQWRELLSRAKEGRQEERLRRERHRELGRQLGLSGSQYSQLEDKVYVLRSVEVEGALTRLDYPFAFETIDLTSRLGASLEREERMQKLFSRHYIRKPLYPNAGKKGEAKPDSSLEIYEKLFSEYGKLYRYDRGLRLEQIAEDREWNLEKIVEDLQRTGLVRWPLNAQDFPQYVTPLRYRPPVLPRVDLDDPSAVNSAIRSQVTPFPGCTTTPVTGRNNTKWPLIPMYMLAWRSRRKNKRKRT